MSGCICIWLMAFTLGLGSSDNQSSPELAAKEFRTAVSQQIASMKSIFVEFWDRDFPKYELHGVIQSLIQQIDNEEMLKFLQDRGIPLTPEKILTAENLITYWQHKKLGTQAAWAWLDLLKGNPDFVRAVIDWNTIRQERGFEFVPTYYLLFKAKLETPRDREVWVDLFKATFATLGEQDSDKKMLMLFCSFTHVLGDLKEMGPPLVEHFAFLVAELKKQEDTSKPYPQALLFALFETNFAANRFNEAAAYAARLQPPARGLHLSFIVHVLAKDLDAATAVFSRIEKLTPRDEKMLDGFRQILDQLKKMKQREESGEAAETTP